MIYERTRSDGKDGRQRHEGFLLQRKKRDPDTDDDKEQGDEWIEEADGLEATPTAAPPEDEQ